MHKAILSDWPRCTQCGRVMTPAEGALGPVCRRCVDANWRTVAGRASARRKNTRREGRKA